MTSWDAFTGENFRRGGFLRDEDRNARAEQFLPRAWELFDSWRGDEVIADKRAGRFRTDPAAGRFAHRTRTSTSPGGSTCRAARRGARWSCRPGLRRRPRVRRRPRPTRSSAGTARCTRPGVLRRREGRLARYGRTPDELLILPAATLVLGDTDADAQERAVVVRHQQVGGQTAVRSWSRCGTATSARTTRTGRCPRWTRWWGAHHRAGLSVRTPGSTRHRAAVARTGRGQATVHPRARHRGRRPADVHRRPDHGRRGDQ